MINIKKKENCTGCYACYSICPKNCIVMTRDEEGFEYPKVDKELCVKCGKCIDVCPVKNEDIIPEKTETYSAINTNEYERLNSSSGGVFTLLSEYILNHNGVVVGVELNDEFQARHNLVDNIEKLDGLRGSKYLQSSLGTIFKEIKDNLEDDKLVLFTGTPCQVAGLKKYLKHDYRKLICQDIICHGVPSPKIWEEYLKYRKKQYNNSKIKEVNFREKEDCGWRAFNMRIEFEEGLYLVNHDKDHYMKLFLKNISLRPSCYWCKFKKNNYYSDISLADYWGIWNIDKDMYDNKGTSLVILRSEKGKLLYDKINSDLVEKSTDLKVASKYNKCINYSVHEPLKRNKFYEMIYEKKDFDEIIRIIFEKDKKNQLLDKINYYIADIRKGYFFDKLLDKICR